MTTQQVWKPAHVSCVGDERYPAEVLVGRRWNGWAIPRFRLETVHKIAADTAKLRLECGPTGCDLVTVDHVGIVRVFDSYGGVDYVLPDADGMYPIGAFDWCWYEDEPPAPPMRLVEGTRHIW